MQITKISEQVKNVNRASIFVDGRYAFSLSLSQLLDLHLKVGAEIDKTQLAKYKNVSSEGKLKMQALEWLMIRPRSAKEFTDYLKRKAAKPGVIEKWVVEFEQKGYLGDEAFGKWWLEQRLAQHKSLNYVKSELRLKGLKPEIIETVLAGNQDNEKAALQALIAKKRRLAKFKDNQKLLEYLLRQGYRYSSVKEALESITE